MTERTDAPPDQISSTLIYDYVRGAIAAGRLRPGDRLPTVRQTAADLGAAQGTAARAFTQLERDGYVVTRRGAGTRVAPDVGALPRSVVTLLRLVADDAERAGFTIEDAVTALRTEWLASARAATRTPATASPRR